LWFSQTDQPNNPFAGLAEQIHNAQLPQDSDLGSLGIESRPRNLFSIAEFERRALINPIRGRNLQKINDVDDLAIAAVGIQITAVASIGELGGAFLASETGIATGETIRQMGINIVANKELLLIHAGRLQNSLSGGEGLGFALSNSANTSAYPAWLLTRGAAAAVPPTITAIVD